MIRLRRRIHTYGYLGRTYHPQAVQCSECLSSAFLGRWRRNDGLLGLKWPAIGTGNSWRVKTPVESMVEQELVEEPLFTMKLSGGHRHHWHTGFYSLVRTYTFISHYSN